MSLLLYALAAALLAGGAALFAERALRATGRPGRWPWLAAALLTIALPGAAALGRSAITVAVPLDLPVLSAEASSPTPWLIAWATMSGALLLALVRDAVRLRLRARRWVPARVAGVPVRIAATTGPATIGVLRPSIVLPRWTLELRPRERRLVVLHELEHARAGDVALLAGMAALLVAVPWHPVLWWQATRLHRAIELDCDARVALRAGDVRAYARLLLYAGERTRRPPLLAAAFGRRRPLLHRRIEALVRPRARRGVAPAAGCAFALALAACIAPVPTEPAAPAGVFRVVERPATNVVRPSGGTITRRPEGPGRYEIRELPAGEVRVAPAGVIRARGGSPDR